MLRAFGCLAASWALSLVGAGCGWSSPEAEPTAPATVTTDLGDFVVSVEDGARLVVSGSRGDALLDGLAPSDDVGQGFAMNEADPPMTGFALRQIHTTNEMLYGSFDIADTPDSPWLRADALALDGATKIVTITSAGEVIATLALSNGDDADELVVDAAPGPSQAGRRLSWGFRCDATDHFHGFGSQTWGVDARGESVPIWVSEEGIHKNLDSDDPTGLWFLEGRRHSAYMPRPEYLASRGYFAVAETDARSVFAMCSEREDVARLQLELPFKLHLFYGPAPVDALTRKTARFGRARVPPAFAFAPWNDAIQGSANVRAVAKELRDAKIPSSVIWTEDWRGGEASTLVTGGYTLDEEWDVDRTLYPDFEQVATELHAEGFKWLVYFNPFVEKGSRAYPETAPVGYLIRKNGNPYLFQDAKLLDSSLVDLSMPAAAAWAAGKMAAAIALGADGWMGDYSEWLPADAELTGGVGDDLHNGYPVLWQQAQRAALDGVGDGVERLSFVRTGWAGTAELADVFWAGDQSTDFAVDDGMPTVLPIGIGVGLAGVSTFGSDVGGYQTTGTDPTTKEVFFRWTELGAWSPVMRTHHTTAPSLSWSFDRDAETLAHWARYAKLHMSLAPYLRGLARVAHDSGVPMWRSIALLAPSELELWPVADEVMLGDGVLVAPVQAGGASGRSVRLPSGAWFPWSGGASVAGGGVIQASAALSEIPVYARAGSIVPTFPDGVETLVREPSSAAGAVDARVVYVFAGSNGAFAEDDGPSYAVTSSPAAAAGAVTATFEGSEIAVDDASGAAHATVSGSGTLSFTRGGQVFTTLSLRGAAATTAFEVVLRY